MIMNTTTRISKAEHFGRWLGRGWCGFVRAEQRLSGWIVAQGLPASIANALLWIAKLTVLTGLLYTALWLALLLVFAIVAAWVTRNADWDDDERPPEWREGYDGYGLYDNSGWRIDLGDPDER